MPAPRSDFFTRRHFPQFDLAKLSRITSGSGEKFAIRAERDAAHLIGVASEHGNRSRFVWVNQLDLLIAAYGKHSAIGAKGEAVDRGVDRLARLDVGN